MGAALFVAFSDGMIFNRLTQRFSLGGEAGLLVAFGDKNQNCVTCVIH